MKYASSWTAVESRQGAPPPPTGYSPAGTSTMPGGEWTRHPRHTTHPRMTAPHTVAIHTAWREDTRRWEGGVASASTNARAVRRSEEHTSELQSLTNLVCRLLLEKKKKKHQQSRLSRPKTSHIKQLVTNNRSMLTTT